MGELASDTQAAELFSALETRSLIFGEPLQTGRFWNLGRVALPLAILKRCELPLNKQYGYSGQVMGPYDVEAGKQMSLNFVRPFFNHRNNPTDHIQYRAIRSTAGSAQLEKYYIGQSGAFADLDRMAATQRVSQAEEVSMDEAIRQTLEEFENLLDKRVERRKQADELAKGLGMTAVFHDEAEALLELVSNA